MESDLKKSFEKDTKNRIKDLRKDTVKSKFLIVK